MTTTMTNAQNIIKYINQFGGPLTVYNMNAHLMKHYSEIVHEIRAII